MPLRKLICRLLAATLLSALLGLGTEVKAQPCTSSSKAKNEALAAPDDGRARQVAEEPQGLGGTTLRTASSSQRVVLSRPVRLLPTHGGKPTNHGGRWINEESFNRLIPFTLLSGCHGGPSMRAASPRLRYVIALRRLLC